MWWNLAIGAYALGLTTAVLLWARGLLRANRGDVVLAWCLFAVLSIPMVRFPPLIGAGAILFAVVTLLVGRVAPADCPVQRGERRGISACLFAAGVFSLLLL